MDLDDRILHYVLVAAGLIAGSALQYAGGKLAAWVFSKFKRGKRK